MRSTFRRAASLGEDELRALWRFRLSLIRLKPSVSPEQDFAAFAADFRWPGYVWILRERGRVSGFFLQRGEPVDFQGRALFCLLPEYGFIAPHLRGHPVLPLAAVLITLLTLGRHALRPRYLAASTYPPGYIAFCRAVRPVWTLADPALPAWERGLLLHLAERVAGAHFCAADGTVTMRTIPRVDRAPGAAGGPDSQRLYAQYAAANPRWAEGRGLFFLIPLGPGQLVQTLRDTAQRLGRGRRAR